MAHGYSTIFTIQSKQAMEWMMIETLWVSNLRAKLKTSSTMILGAF